MVMTIRSDAERLAKLQLERARKWKVDFARPVSSRRLRSIVAAADLLAELRPVVKRQRTAEVRRKRTARDLAAKHALPWAKQQKPAKSKPPQPWVEKPWCQGCDRYHVEGKHGSGRAK